MNKRLLDRSRLTQQRKRIPDLSLESDAGRFSLLPRRGSLVLLLVHDESCGACRQYFEQLSRESTELAVWDSAIAVVVPAARVKSDVTQASSARILYDPDRRVETLIEARAPAVAIIDQWGDITDVHAAGPDHAFPAATEVVSWARFLGTQCPECEGEAY